MSIALHVSAETEQREGGRGILEMAIVDGAIVSCTMKMWVVTGYPAKGETCQSQ